MDEGEATFEPDTVIGSYRLTRPLGTGGMSSVFRAVHIEHGHEVALKLLPRALAKNQTLLSRFLREANAAEALEHPNIVSIFDRGVDDGRHYLILELVEGGDLQDRVKAQGPLAIPEAVGVIKAVAEGLRYAVGKGLIHRDIKPANLLLAPTGLVKIIDLGLAVQSDNEDERVTRDGTTVGTVDYMAPEQARDSRATNERSDIYSLGCTFYFLLTGSPPFPGGNINDKLSRHFTAPRPDPRQLRPEVPEALARLVQRMMAKRPEHRFKNYDELIAALEVVPTNPSEFGLEPLDEENEFDSGEGPAPTLSGSKYGDPPQIRASDPALAKTTTIELNLAPRGDEVRPGSSQLHTRNNATGKHRLPEPEPAPAIDLAEIEGAEPEEEEAVDTVLVTKHEPVEDTSGAMKKLIVAYAVGGIALMMFLVGIFFAFNKTSPELPRVPEVVQPGRKGEAGQEGDGHGQVAVVPKGTENPAPLPVTPPPVTGVTDPSTPTSPATSSAPGEPADVVVPLAADVAYPAETEAKYLPAWARTPVPQRVPGIVTTVRRIVDPKDPAQVPTLQRAFDIIGGTIELDDNGPFFEDNLRISGESRLIRARPGFRPIICIESPQVAAQREQKAVFVLDKDRSLTFDGLDIIVDVKDLPTYQTALFLCNGGSTLTLRNCTVTVINSLGGSFSVFQTGASSRPAKIRLEGSLLRGTAFQALALGKAPAEVVMIRSVLVNQRGALIGAARPEPKVERRIYLNRCLLASVAQIFECEVPLANSGALPLEVHVLATTFGRFETANKLAKMNLIRFSEDVAQVGDVLRWSGDDNVYNGWSEWIALGPGRVVKVANLAAARKIWAAVGPKSVEKPELWPPPSRPDKAVPNDFAEVAADRLATIQRVAAPTPYLHERTVGRFPALVIPQHFPTIVAPMIPELVAELPPTAMMPNPNAPPRNVVDAIFDPEEPTWKGDLGLFIREQLKAAVDRRVRIKVIAGGVRTMTPVQMPEGVSLEIVYDPPPPEQLDPSRPPKTKPLVISPIKGAAGDALIDVRGADLLISNVRFERDASARLKNLIKVDDGMLLLDRCWLIAPGEVERGGGGLIAFRAPGTKPLATTPPSSLLFDIPPDRPVCRLIDTLLITGGDAIVLELGRGLVCLSDCILYAGGTALGLVPTKVARSRLDVGLRLDHCTLAAERTFVQLNRWLGTDPGPDKPWLVETHNTAFIGTSFNRVGLESVLLRVEPEAMAHGALFWEAAGDAFEVVNFTARTDGPPPPNIHYDVTRQWIDLWGAHHMRNVVGQGVGDRVRFVNRLQPGNIAPGDLLLDIPKRGGFSMGGADPRRLQIKAVGAGR